MPPPASIEQLDTLIRALGELDARRRGLNLRQLDRVEAADLIAAALAELGVTRITARGVQLPAPAPQPGRRSELTADERRARKRERNRDYRERLAAEMAADPDHPKHGTLTGYTAGSCREACCSAAMRQYNTANRAG